MVKQISHSSTSFLILNVAKLAVANTPCPTTAGLLLCPLTPAIAGPVEEINHMIYYVQSATRDAWTSPTSTDMSEIETIIFN